ncbi:MAG: hypothetical protein J6B01_04870 [Ruminococcus sp.]|nr:hypothetical protein [Ruminococcus sp.]MBO5319125.1 hypothetical protein [Ruminococcus sp.]
MSSIEKGLKKFNKGHGMLLAGLAMVGIDKVSKGLANKNRAERVIGYDDAIKAIMYSSSYDSFKREATSLVKFGQSPEYYGAIIRVVHSSMFSSSKIKAIKSINENVGEIRA